ncbi:MAG: replicative helicase loader/inhibitor [Rhodospirillaceae bacterium]
MNVPKHILDLFALVRAAYPRFEFTAETVPTWALLLGDVDPDRLGLAVVRHCRTSKFPPTVAELIEASRPPNQETAADAWGAVCESVRFDRRAAPSELAERAVQGIGGWRVIENQTDQSRVSNRAQFIAAYQSARERRESSSDYAQAALAAGSPEVGRLLAQNGIRLVGGGE